MDALQVRVAAVAARWVAEAPPFSFVVPTLNEAGRITDLLRTLRRRFPAAELLVVDGGSHDATVRQALPHSDQLLIGEAGRAAQMNLGGRAARGAYLIFLHADSEPLISQEQLLALLATQPAWGFFPVRLSGKALAFRVIERFINWRSALTGVGTGDQMLYLQRDMFAQTGGFDEIPLMEDVAYCKRLKAKQSPVIPRTEVLTSSRRWEEQGVIATVLRMWALRLAYFLGMSPTRLWRFYYGR